MKNWLKSTSIMLAVAALAAVTTCSGCGGGGEGGFTASNSPDPNHLFHEGVFQSFSSTTATVLNQGKSNDGVETNERKVFVLVDLVDSEQATKALNQNASSFLSECNSNQLPTLFNGSSLNACKFLIINEQVLRVIEENVYDNETGNPVE